MGIPLREGRFIDDADSSRAERACVVDEIFARRYWPRGGALGQHLFTGTRLDEDEQPFTVVGVVGAVKQSDLTEHTAHGGVYFPFSRYFARNYFLVARTGVAPEGLAATLRGIVRRIDPELPLNDLRSMEVRIADTLVVRRSPALLAGIFAGVALLLAALGTYGVLSYAVAQRRREIGVRMALGAQPKQVWWLIARRAFIQLAIGLAIGMPAAFGVGKVLQSLLVQTSPSDPTTLVSIAMLLISVAVTACYWPARRATQLDPLVALRYE
jgi:hypothetical protein